MPVNSEMYLGLFPSPSSPEIDDMEMFECKDFCNNNSCEEEIWEKYHEYLLTPPQSPPVIPSFGNFEEYTSEFDMAINGLPSTPVLDDDELNDAAAVAAIDDVLLGGGTDSLLNELDGECITGADIGIDNFDLDVLHDCMWSGQCSANCNSSRLNLCPNAHKRERSATSVNATGNTLGTSPTASLINFALNDMCANSCSVEGHLDDEEDEEENDEVDDIQGRKRRLDANSSDGDACDEEEDEVDSIEGYNRLVTRKAINPVAYDTGATLLASTNESLKNDHSYGSPASSPRSIKKCKSLIYSKGCIRSKGVKASTIKSENLQSQAMTIKFVNKSIAASKSSSNTEFRRCKLSQSKRTASSSSSNSQGLTHLNSNSKSRNSNRQTNGDFGPSLLAKSSSHNSSNTALNSSCSLLSFSSSQSSNSSQSSVRGSSVNSSSSSSSSTTGKSTKSMYPERRREHNDSERKRRDHLRNAFHYLRDQIPKLKDAQKKPARIVILGEATTFVRSLQEKQRYLERMKDAEARKRDKLIKKVNLLKEKYHIN